MAWLVVLSVACLGQASDAGTCAVPGTHNSINSAINDSGCTEVALGQLVYNESVDITRSIDLLGPQTGRAEIRGPVRLAGQATAVRLERLLFVETACSGQALIAEAGAQIEAFEIDVVFDPDAACFDVLFLNGFEGGATALKK